MKYVSSFIHIPSASGSTIAIDVTTIDTISGKDGKVEIYCNGCVRPATIAMSREKVIDMVEQRRREIWEQQAELIQVQTQLLLEIRDNTKPIDPAEHVKIMRDLWFGEPTLNHNDRTSITVVDVPEPKE